MRRILLIAAALALGGLFAGGCCDKEKHVEKTTNTERVIEKQGPVLKGDDESSRNVEETTVQSSTTTVRDKEIVVK